MVYKPSELKRDDNGNESAVYIENTLKHVLTKKEYTCSELKDEMQKVYDDLGVQASAKASDITKYIPTAREKKVRDSNGERQRGYKLW